MSRIGIQMCIYCHNNNNNFYLYSTHPVLKALYNVYLKIQYIKLTTYSTYNILSLITICDPPYDLMLKVIARSHHAYTTRLVCPEDTDMRILNSQTKRRHTCLVFKEFNQQIPLSFLSCTMSRLVCQRPHACS